MNSKIKRFIRTHPRASDVIAAISAGWLLIASLCVRLGYVPPGVWSDLEFMVTVTAGLMLALWADWRPRENK